MLRSSLYSAKLLGIPLCRVMVSRYAGIHQQVRCISFKKQSEMSRKEREIIRYDGMECPNR